MFLHLLPWQQITGFKTISHMDSLNDYLGLILLQSEASVSGHVSHSPSYTVALQFSVWIDFREETLQWQLGHRGHSYSHPLLWFGETC